MNESKQKIALFIDAENAPAAKFEEVLSEVAKYGVVTIRKAYGDWKNRSIKAWEALLHEYAIQPIQQYALTKGKNAADIALVIDAMDVMYTKNIDVMCFVSSDSDFTPMVTRALAEGKVVLGFGERKAPMPFVNACSKFLFLDSGTRESGSKQSRPKSINSDTKLLNLIRRGIEATEDDSGWSNLSTVGKHISNKTSFDTRNYGFKNLSALIEAANGFQLKRGPDNNFLVKDVKKKRMV